MPLRRPDNQPDQIDWGYPFAKHGWDRGGTVNPAAIPEYVERVQTLTDALARNEPMQATTDGGWPRVGWGEVLGVEGGKSCRIGQHTPNAKGSQ